MFLKRAAVILSAILAFSFVLCGCNPEEPSNNATVTSVEIVEDGLKTEYTVGDTFNYAAVKLKVTYSDQKNKELNLASEGVTHNELDMATAGDKTLTATYEGKSDSVQITVKEAAADDDLTLFQFEAPQTYSAVQKTDDPKGLASTDGALLLKGIGTYKVGADNGFDFTPDASTLDLVTEDEKTIQDPETTFELFVKNGAEFAAESDPAKYVSKKTGSNNIYLFTQEAVGKTFRLVVKPAEKYDLSMLDGSASITAEFEVVHGYNVYDQLGLSVFDNLNLKHWQAIKEGAQTLKWDEKPLVEYNRLDKENAYVENIVLHASITIDPDELPDNYFWDKDRSLTEKYSDGTAIGDQGYTSVMGILDSLPDGVKENFKQKLNGSLRDYGPQDVNEGGAHWNNFNSASQGSLAEDYKADSVNMQKGVYNSAGTGIIGNGMMISYQTYGKKHSLVTIYDGERKGEQGASPLSHWSLFKYPDEGVVREAYPEAEFSTTPVIENVKISGEMERLSETDGEPAQLMGFNTCTDLVTLKNSLISRVFVALIGDKAQGRSSASFENCKVLDIYSNMIYSWRATVTVKTSIFKDAGGPIAILCDGNRVEWDRTQAVPVDHDFALEEGDTNYGPHLIADAESVLESKASGYEPWYKLNGISDTFAMLKGGQGNGLADAARYYLGREIVEKEGQTELINVIAAIISEPGQLMEEKNYADSITISGHAEIGDEKWDMRMKLPNPGGFMGSVVLERLLGANAPIFASEDKVALYGDSAMEGMNPSLYGFGGSKIATTTGGEKNSWKVTEDEVRTVWGEVTSSHLFITMRVSANVVNQEPKSVTPRFGILIGGVTKAVLAQ